MQPPVLSKLGKSHVNLICLYSYLRALSTYSSNVELHIRQTLAETRLYIPYIRYEKMPDNYITSSTNTAAHFNNCLTFAKTAIQNNFNFLTSTLSFRFALPAEKRK